MFAGHQTVSFCIENTNVLINTKAMTCYVKLWYICTVAETKLKYIHKLHWLRAN